MLGDHLVFPIVLSTDLAVSRAFYHGKLGLEIAAENADRIMFRCGGGSVLTVSLSTTGTSDTQTQLAWRVPDLKAELADLRARGVEIQEYDAPDPKTRRPWTGSPTWASPGRRGSSIRTATSSGSSNRRIPRGRRPVRRP